MSFSLDFASNINSNKEKLANDFRLNKELKQEFIKYCNNTLVGLNLIDSQHELYTNFDKTLDIINIPYHLFKLISIFWIEIPDLKKTTFRSNENNFGCNLYNQAIFYMKRFNLPLIRAHKDLQMTIQNKKQQTYALEIQPIEEETKLFRNWSIDKSKKQIEQLEQLYKKITDIILEFKHFILEWLYSGFDDDLYESLNFYSKHINIGDNPIIFDQMMKNAFNTSLEFNTRIDCILNASYIAANTKEEVFITEWLNTNDVTPILDIIHKTKDVNQMNRPETQFMVVLLYFIIIRTQIGKDQLVCYTNTDNIRNGLFTLIDALNFVFDETISSLKKINKGEKDVKIESTKKLLDDCYMFLQCLDITVSIFKEFLNSDDIILRKLANFIFYIIDTYAGVSRVTIKVDGINPKLMLSYTLKLLTTSMFETNIQTYLSSSPSWKTAILLAQKYNLLNNTELGILYILCDESIEELEVQYPDELCDIFTCEPLLDPVELPISKEIVNRQSIITSLMDTQINPFNRTPLTIQQLDEYNLLPDVKQRCDTIKTQVINFTKK